MMDLLARALQQAATRQTELLPMLERWVRQNSFSGSVAGVNAMGTLLAEDFDLPGLTLERHPGNGVGDHLVWKTDSWDARPDERRVILGHHDTVFPPDTFDMWHIDGDRLQGPGVLDMKGGLAIVRTALAALADVGVLADMPLAIISVGDEEIGSNDSRALTQEVSRNARAALVFEAGRVDDMLITQRKGTGRMTIDAIGKAAHAGNHHPDGVNAIWALALFVDIAQRYTDYDRGVTINVGLIEGGSSANTVPGNARCVIDFRFVRAEDGRAAVAAMTEEARKLSDTTGATITVDGDIRRLPMERTDESVALMRAYGACARLAGLGDTECPLRGGGSDANTVSAIGVPAIDGLGPRGKGFHTHDEFIEISSLALKLEALVRYLLG